MTKRRDEPYTLIERRRVEQRKAWRRGEMVYVRGTKNTYHLPGEVKPDGALKSVCGAATGKIGVFNCMPEKEPSGMRLCGTCARLSPTQTGRAA